MEPRVPNVNQRILASIYVPLGIVAPVLLQGKFIYRDVCDRKLTWDQQLPEEMGEV